MDNRLARRMQRHESMSFHPTRRQLLSLLAGAALYPTPARAEDERRLFSFFYAFDCPHCAKAKPFVAKLERQHRDVRFESWEVKKDPEGRKRFAKEVTRLQIRDPGVPLFVCRDDYEMGWYGEKTMRRVQRMLAGCKKAR